MNRNLEGSVGITLGTIPISNQFVAERAIAIEEIAPETFLSEDCKHPYKYEHEKYFNKNEVHVIITFLIFINGFIWIFFRSR